MSAPRPFVRQTLVPLLGFTALALFLLNFYTYLSHALPQSDHTDHFEHIEAPKSPPHVHVAPLPPGLDAEMRALEIKLMRGADRLAVAEERLRAVQNEILKRGEIRVVVPLPASR